MIDTGDGSPAEERGALSSGWGLAQSDLCPKGVALGSGS